MKSTKQKLLMNNQLWLIPQSRKAKNRLANTLENQCVVIIEQETDTDWFVVSANGKWCRWINKYSDPDWCGVPIVELTSLLTTSETSETH